MSAPQPDAGDDMVVNLGAVRRQLMEGEELAPFDQPAPPAPEPEDDEEPDDEAPEIEWNGDRPYRVRRDGLPEGCPVIPLGTKGNEYYYLDPLGQLRPMLAKDHGQLGIKSLFGREIHLLYEYWPRFNKEGEATGWKPEDGATALMRACARKNVWSPENRVHGRGAWLGRDGELVLHCGDKVWVGAVPSGGLTGYANGLWVDPGMIGAFVYPADEALQRPQAEPLNLAMRHPGLEILKLFGSWNWRRQIDSMVMLGWLMSAKFGGALKWRPLAWITGGAGTGKSTLQKTLEFLLDGGLLAVADATEAGIRQTIGSSTLPVIVDELESEEDNRTQQKIVKLARNAATGARATRGGQNHGATQFVTQSCFLMAAIVLPPLTQQDRSRMAILDLRKLIGADGKAPSMVPDAAQLRADGAGATRHVVDQWHRLEATFEIYRTALHEVGHDARGADVFGTLLTMADLALHPELPELEGARALADQLTVESLAEWGDDKPDEVQFLNHLLSSPVDAFSGGRREPVGVWILRAAGGDDDGDQAHSLRECNDVLRAHGLLVMELDAKDGRGVQQFLAIANSSTGLSKLLEGTHWRGRAGSSAPWIQAARRLERAIVAPRFVWFGHSARATLVPLDVVLAGAPRRRGTQTTMMDLEEP